VRRWSGVSRGHLRLVAASGGKQRHGEQYGGYTAVSGPSGCDAGGRACRLTGSAMCLAGPDRIGAEERAPGNVIGAEPRTTPMPVSRNRGERGKVHSVSMATVLSGRRDARASSAAYATIAVWVTIATPCPNSVVSSTDLRIVRQCVRFCCHRYLRIASSNVGRSWEWWRPGNHGDGYPMKMTGWP
jgi:hypothetical protein